MIYFPEKEVVFLHIPRTGGFWVHQTSKLCGIPCVYPRWNRGQKSCGFTPHHHSLPLHLLKRDWIPRNRLMWTTVRHPLDYYEAIWRILIAYVNKFNGKPTLDWILRRFRRRHIHTRWWFPFREMTLATRGMKTLDFNQWIENNLEMNGNFVTRYFEMVVGPRGGEWCGYVARNDTLNDDFIRLMDLIGYGSQATPEKVNGAERVHYSRYRPKLMWREDLKRQMEHEERFAIERWWGKDTKDERFYGELEMVGGDFTRLGSNKFNEECTGSHVPKMKRAMKWFGE